MVPISWPLDCLTITIRILNIDGLVQERRNSIANALELPLSCTTNPMIYELNSRTPVMSYHQGNTQNIMFDSYDYMTGPVGKGLNWIPVSLQ